MEMELQKPEVRLSRAEAAVHELMLEGLTNQQIADKLFVAEKTVRFHLTNIYKKLGIKGRSEINFLRKK